MDAGQLAATLAKAGVDPHRYRIAGRPDPAAGAGSRASQEAVLLTGSARTGTWYVKGGQDVVPGWPTVLREFADEAQACAYFCAELTRPDGSAFTQEKARWVETAEELRAQAETELARQHPERATERARWHREWEERRASGAPLMTRDELRRAAEVAGTFEPYWIDPGPADPVIVPDFDPDSDETWESQETEPWPADHFLLAWDGYDECWVTGSRRPGAQPEYHLRFTAEDEACAYVFEYLTSPRTVPPRLTPAQWQALQTEQPSPVLTRPSGTASSAPTGS
ncbi:hypothetical protein [Streptacidiphilus rugosus]|uniref:hypothetical protein n=1 Tax=Streptacidiphilus rugosus TaxID=405783 RepID=UPI00056CC96D|nr:hypothetical protein [Streptacidiphilus rugosus]